MLFQDSDSSTCPMGCGNEETALHHLSCPKIPGYDLRFINRWMSHNNTAPPVQLAIITSLKAWTASEPTPFFPEMIKIHWNAPRPLSTRNSQCWDGTKLLKAESARTGRPHKACVTTTCATINTPKKNFKRTTQDRFGPRN